MTGLDKIIQQISNEAVSAAASSVEAANKEAATIVWSVEDKGAKQCDKISQDSVAEVADYLSRAKSAAQLQKRQALLNAKLEIISDVIEKAKKALCELSDEEYFETITKMVKKYSIAEKGEIVFSEKDLARMPLLFDKKISRATAKGGGLKISEETRDIDGGFILLYEGIEVNCSFSAIFESERDAFQDKVHEILFS
ncbi:MAG: V-type ATP synthase subunit E [Oscillospiraceae bacterium]